MLAHFKRILFLYNIGLAAAGLAMSILSLTLLTTAPIPSLAPQSLLILTLIIGILLIFVSALGAFGVLDSANKPIMIAHSLLLLAMVGTLVWGVLEMSKGIEVDVIRKRLDDLWLRSDTATILQIQSWGQCCGFQDYSDRIQEPCTKYTPEVGCLSVMTGPYQSRLHVLYLPCHLLLVAMGLGVIGNAVLGWWMWRDGKEAKIVGDRQPFEAWHKAVFQ